MGTDMEAMPTGIQEDMDTVMVDMDTVMVDMATDMVVVGIKEFITTRDTVVMDMEDMEDMVDMDMVIDSVIQLSSLYNVQLMTLRAV